MAVCPTGRQLAVGLSSLEGNVWKGAVQILRYQPRSRGQDEGGTTSWQPFQVVGELPVNAGVSSLCWVAGDRIAFGADDGVIRLARLSVGQGAEISSSEVPTTSRTTTPTPTTTVNPSATTRDVSSSSASSAGGQTPLPPLPHDDLAPPLPPGTAFSSGSLVQDSLSCSKHDDLITSLACSPLERNVVVSGGWDNFVRRWDVTRDPESGGGACQSIRGHSAEVEAVACSPSSPDIAASASLDATWRLWDFRQSSRRNGGAQSSVRSRRARLPEQCASIAFHPTDGISVAIGTAVGGVAICDVRNIKKPLHTLRPHNGAVFGVLFLSNTEESAPREPDVDDRGNSPSYRIATCSADGSCQISAVEAAGKVHVEKLSGHTDYVRNVVALPSSFDSRGDADLVTCSWDRTLRTWAR